MTYITLVLALLLSVYASAFVSIGGPKWEYQLSSSRSSKIVSVFSSPNNIGDGIKMDPLERLDRTGFFDPFEVFGVDSLAPSSSSNKKPVLLYLPGLEASGLTAFVQYPALADVFELQCLSVPHSDRSSFPELIQLVRQQIKTYNGRDVFIMGESFGGLLALGAFLDTVNKPSGTTGKSIPQEKIKGVVLVNPATSFKRTLWSKLGPVIAKFRGPLYTLGMIPISLLLIDAGQIKSILDDAISRVGKPKQDDKARMASLGLTEFQVQFFTAVLPVLIKKLDLLPPGTLDWRLSKWLNMGCDMVEPQLHRVKVPVLVVAGTVDRLLPSYEEAKRLEKELPFCTVHFAQGSGHGGSLDQRLNLTDVLRSWEPVNRVVAPTTTTSLIPK